MRGWKKIFHANGNQKKAGVAILITDKIHFKIKNVTRDKEGHYIMIKESIQEKNITIINIPKDLNVRPDTVKLLEENIGRILYDINHSKILFDPPREMEIKTKINKGDLMKLKSFCTPKETINKMKRQPSMGENICKRSNRQRINFQNIQAAHAVQ